MNRKILFTLRLFLISITLSTRMSFATEHQFTLMLDPAGDAQYTGRKVDDSFERGITLQCAQQLKTLIEKKDPTIRIVLTRFPGETIQPLQNANFANRLDVDLYLSIHFYQEQATKPTLFIYTFSYGNELPTRAFDLSFYPYDKAHLISQGTTKQWAHLMKEIFSEPVYKKQCEVKGIFSLPFAPLIGIKAPAIAVEIGLKAKEDWQQYLQPMCDSVISIVKKRATA